MTYATHPNPRGRATTIGAVAVIHGVVIYGLIAGLAGVFRVAPPPPILTAPNVPLDPPSPTPTPAQATKPPHPDPFPTALPTLDPLPMPFPTLNPFPTGPTPGATGSSDAGPITPTLPSVPPKLAMPRGNPHMWLTTDDYPAQDLREGNAGVTGVRLSIAANGKPLSCAITQSSGFARLDEATCRNMLRRGVFTPASDSTGAATVGSYQTRVKWTIPV